MWHQFLEEENTPGLLHQSLVETRFLLEEQTAMVDKELDADGVADLDREKLTSCVEGFHAASVSYCPFFCSAVRNLAP